MTKMLRLLALVFTWLIVQASALVAEKPNVVLLVSDDQRLDTIAALGNPIIQTPNLDQIAKTGSVFTRAICANPICTPSRAEILTGCSGFRNGVLDFGGGFREGLVRWAEAMRAAGYHTCYVGKWHNKGRPSSHGYVESRGLYGGGGGRWWRGGKDHHGREVTGYRGWVFQTDDRKLMPEKGVGLTPDISAKFADAAISLIESKPAKPFFLHVNFTAPHDPLLMPAGYADKYDPKSMPLPKSFRERHPFDHGNYTGRDEKLLPWPRTPEDVQADLAVYYSVISHLDEQVGRILNSLKQTGQWDNTIVVYTSDHGLAMGSHGLRGKQNMYEHTIGIPLLMRGPGVPAGKKFDAQVYLRDLYPTICELTGVAIPDSVEGHSAAPVLAGKQKAIYEHVFGYFRNFQRMVRTDRWKLVHYPSMNRSQLFDLKSDPDELNDLSANVEHAQTLKELRGKLVAWQKEVDDPALDGKPITRIALGSCVKQNRPTPIWSAIVEKKPDMFLFIGDNIYGDTENMETLKRKYGQLAAQSGYQKLKEICPILATWDDHDYGENDAGVEYPKKVESQKIFNDFFEVPADSPRRRRPGVYDAQIFGPAGKRVQVILLDTRYFRSPLQKRETRIKGIGPYTASDDLKATMLGTTQWRWLEEQLQKPADLRIVASSIQVVAEEHGWEMWGNFPEERKRLFALIAKTKANGVVFISGDRHLAEISRQDTSDANPAKYPLYDLTSSSLNQPSGGGNEAEPNRHRVGKHYPKTNFGMITIDWKETDAEITLAIHNEEGEAVGQSTIRLSQLKSGD